MTTNEILFMITMYFALVALVMISTILLVEGGLI